VSPCVSSSLQLLHQPATVTWNDLQVRFHISLASPPKFKHYFAPGRGRGGSVSEHRDPRDSQGNAIAWRASTDAKRSASAFAAFPEVSARQSKPSDGSGDTIINFSELGMVSPEIRQSSSRGFETPVSLPSKRVRHNGSTPPTPSRAPAKNRLGEMSRAHLLCATR